MIAPKPLSIVSQLRGLTQGPRELYLVYALKLLESFADFSTSLNLVVYLSSEFDMSDEYAGAVYGAWGVATSVFGMAFGAAIDYCGVRQSLVVGGALVTVGRAMLAWAPSRAHALASLFIVQPAGMALAIPVLSIAIRRTTDNTTRAVAYATFYATMNVGALLSGLATDAINTALRTSFGVTGAMRALFWLGAATSAFYTLVAYVYFRDVPVVVAAAAARRRQSADDTPTTWQIVRETWSDIVFWRLCAFYTALFGARTIFRHMDLTLPKWLQRTVSPTANYGLVYALNPAIVISSVTLVQAHLADADPYRVVVVGTAITTLAPLLLAALPASYASAAAFMLVLSVGEVYYSSKIMEFGMLLAPEGREGVYSTLVSVPLFAVRLVAGAASGHLLGAYCPASGVRACRTMWFYIALISATTPITLAACRRWLYADDVQRRIAVARLHIEAPASSDDEEALCAVSDDCESE